MRAERRYILAVVWGWRGSWDREGGEQGAGKDIATAITLTLWLIENDIGSMLELVFESHL